MRTENNGSLVNATLFFGIFGLISLLILVIGAVCFVAFERKRYRKEMEKAKKDLEKKEIPNPIKESLEVLLERRNNYINNWITFQAVNKTSGVGSIVFSIVALTASTISVELWVSLILGLLSILFVITALYLSPSRRVQQYLSAWKRTDYMYHLSLAKEPVYRSLLLKQECAKDQCIRVVDPCDQLIEKEARIIARTIRRSERTLTVESE